MADVAEKNKFPRNKSLSHFFRVLNYEMRRAAEDYSALAQHAAGHPLANGVTS